MIPSEWKIFVLGLEKMPLPNCIGCREAGVHHDRERCECLTCHGLHAATNDPARIAEMRRLHPDNPWAVRCGQPSGITVIDAEGTTNAKGLSGVDVLNDLENFTGFALPPTGLIALTPSGGVHRYYKYVPGIRSRNRVLPQVDIKSDGGYVVLPSESDSRRQWRETGEIGQLSAAMVDWLYGPLRGFSGGGGAAASKPEGYDYQKFLREGCPGGMRDIFFNDHIFRLRKSGKTRQDIVMALREAWKNCAQPDGPYGHMVNGEFATWYMPWWHVEYKIDRAWQTVQPEPDPTPRQLEWVSSLASGAPTKVGNATMQRRPRRGVA